jgi:hypothetical protein
VKNVLLFIIAVIIGVGIVFARQELKPKPIIKPTPSASPSVTPTPFSIEKPPTDSLVGTLEFSGEVEWQSRVATEPAKITASQPLQQGEDVKTATGSAATITFTDAAKISMSQQSELNVSQTLPASFVFVQPMGTIEYERLGTIPLSVRAMHLLIDQEIGDITIMVDKDNANVVVNVKKGSLTAAYNDKNLNSQVITVKQGKRLVFDDETRTAIVR